MSQLDDLRSRMREHGIQFKITKNRITKLALQKTRCKDLSDLFKKAELAKKGVNIKSEEEALKSLMKLWSDSLMIGNKGMEQLGVDITMDDLPESVKETPSKFFKFFEKRFHKKAKKWKKKLYRIASLLQQDREQALQKKEK